MTSRKWQAAINATLSSHESLSEWSTGGEEQSSELYRILWAKKQCSLSKKMSFFVGVAARRQQVTHHSNKIEPIFPNFPITLQWIPSEQWLKALVVESVKRQKATSPPPSRHTEFTHAVKNRIFPLPLCKLNFELKVWCAVCSAGFPSTQGNSINEKKSQGCQTLFGKFGVKITVKFFSVMKDRPFWFTYILKWLKA